MIIPVHIRLFTSLNILKRIFKQWKIYITIKYKKEQDRLHKLLKFSGKKGVEAYLALHPTNIKLRKLFDNLNQQQQSQVVPS